MGTTDSKSPDIPPYDLNTHQWSCMLDQSAWENTDWPTVFVYLPSNWGKIDYPTDNEIKLYIKKIQNSPKNIDRNNAILSTYISTNFQSEIYDIIIDYLPLNNKDETAEFIDQFPGSEIVKEFALNTLYKASYQRILDHGIALINRFLIGTKLISGNNKQINMNDGIKGLLNKWIYIIYWYRNGTERYWDQNKFKDKIIYPFLPSDILGQLKNGKWFYYKDAHPNFYGKGGFSHDKWFYLIGDDLKSLLKQMDKRDIDLFVKHDKHWTEIKFNT